MCLWVDRGLGTITNGNFDNVVGTFQTKKFLFFKYGKKTTFYIPDNFHSILLQKQKCPIFIIDSKSSTVLNAIFEPENKYIILKSLKGKKIELAGLDFTTKFDPTTQVKLNILIKGEFWAMLARLMKQKFLMTLIIMFGGYGLFRFIEYLITTIFG